MQCSSSPYLTDDKITHALGEFYKPFLCIAGRALTLSDGWMERASTNSFPLPVLSMRVPPFLVWGKISSDLDPGGTGNSFQCWTRVPRCIFIRRKVCRSLG